MTTHTQTFRANEKVLMEIKPIAADGLPAQLDANPVVAIADPTVLSAEKHGGTNPYMYWLIAQGAGSTVVTVQATSFGVDVSEQINVTVNDAKAVSLGLVFGTPQPK